MGFISSGPLGDWGGSRSDWAPAESLPSPRRGLLEGPAPAESDVASGPKRVHVRRWRQAEPVVEHADPRIRTYLEHASLGSWERVWADDPPLHIDLYL